MKIIQHLCSIIIVTTIMGLIYTSVQQTYRSNADDPQIQIAHDLRDYLQEGKTLSFDDTIELERSLSVFKEACDENGKPIQSTGFLNGKMPQLPEGLFEYAKANGDYRVTWQPQRSLRMAMCIVRVNKAPIEYLAVGRSLKEVEKRVSQLTKMVFIGWILCVCVILINWLVNFYNYRKNLR